MSNKNYDTKLQAYVSKERKKEIEKLIKEDNWSSISDYVRHTIRAGESNIADLDPRTSRVSKGNEDSTKKEDYITDEELITKINNLTEKHDGEFVDADEIVSHFIEELSEELVDRMFAMSQEDGNLVKTNKVGGFKIEK